MAGDWIKMREDLFEDPAVLKIASKLKTRPEHVVGYLHRFWAWVSRNVSPDDRDKCPAASVIGVPILSLESVLNVPDFLAMLIDVGWLEYTESSPDHGGEPLMTIPKFDRHLSASAKKRAGEAEKKRKQREVPQPRPDSVPDLSRICPDSVPDLSRICPDSVPILSRICPQESGTKNGQKRDQRREEKRRKNLERERENARAPEVGKKSRLDGDLRNACDQWCEYLLAAGSQYGRLCVPDTLRDHIDLAFARECETSGVQHVQRCVDNAIEHNCRQNVPWWRLHPPGERSHKQPNGTALPDFSNF